MPHHCLMRRSRIRLSRVISAELLGSTNFGSVASDSAGGTDPRPSPRSMKTKPAKCSGAHPLRASGHCFRPSWSTRYAASVRNRVAQHAERCAGCDDIAPSWSTSGPKSTSALGQNRLLSGRVGAGQIWPRLAKFGQIVTRTGQTWPNLGENSPSSVIGERDLLNEGSRE